MILQIIMVVLLVGLCYLWTKAAKRRPQITDKLEGENRMIKNLRRSVATGGNIKIGGKGEIRPTRDGQGEYAQPVKYDHFVITKTIREGGNKDANFVVNTEIMTALVKQGWDDDDGKIRRLPIALLRDEIDEVYTTAYVAYAGKSLACRGDGEKAIRYIAPDGKLYPEPIEVPCPCERLEKDEKGDRRCKFNGILHCSLRLPGYAVIGSVYRWRTVSEISVQQMVTHLEDILNAAGTLRGLPLVLALRPQQVSPGGKPKTVYVCHVDLCEDLVIAQRAALEAASMRKQLAGSLLAERDEQYRVTLQLPGVEDDEEREGIIGEFYPDQVVESAAAAGHVVDANPEDLRSTTAPAAGKPPIDAEFQDLGSPPPAAAAAAPPAAATVPPDAGQEGSFECPGDPAGKGRRSRCVVGGGLYYAANLENRVCERCRAKQAAEQPPTTQAPPPSFTKERPKPPPAAEPDPMAQANCQKCGEVLYQAQLVNGLCADCAKEKAPPAPPARPAGPDGPTPRDRFVKAMQDGIRDQKFDGNVAISTVAKRFPEIMAADAKGDYSVWTEEIADQAIAVLQRVEAESTTQG